MSKHSITRSRRGSPLPSFRGGQRGCGRYDFLGEHTQRYCSTDPNRGLWGKVDGDVAGMALSLMTRASWNAIVSFVSPGRASLQEAAFTKRYVEEVAHAAD
jgi:hypothetical protein